MVRAWTGGTCAVALALAGAAAPRSRRPPPAEKYGLRLQYREFRPSLTGDVQKGFEDREGSVVDVDGRARGRRRAHLRRARHHPVQAGLEDARVLHARSTTDGDTEVAAAFNYGETRFARFDRVVTLAEGRLLQRRPRMGLREGAARVPRASSSEPSSSTWTPPSSTSPSTRGSWTRSPPPMPAIGVAGRLYAGRVSLEGEVAGSQHRQPGSAARGRRIGAHPPLRPSGRDGRLPAPQAERQGRPRTR